MLFILYVILNGDDNPQRRIVIEVKNPLRYGRIYILPLFKGFFVVASRLPQNDILTYNTKRVKKCCNDLSIITAFVHFAVC
jgi:hypothetical protein